MIRFARILLTSVAIALALIPLSALADQGGVRNVPASHIEIARFVLIPEQYLVGECVAFKNTSSVEATRVLFLYSVIDKDGKVVFADTHEAKGHFATGALIEGGNPITCQDGSVTLGANYKPDGAIVASVAQVDFADGRSWHAGPDVIGATLRQSDADVKITRAFSWEFGGWDQECVTYANAGSRPVRHVQFMLSHIADDGSVINDDPLDDTFALAPQSTRDMTCRSWHGSVEPRTGAAPDAGVQPQIKVSDQHARLVAWVDKIDYADGTSWHATAPDASAIAAAAVPNKLDFANATWWPATIDVPQSFTQNTASGIEITKSYARDYQYAAECVDFINRSSKPVTHVRFSFAHETPDHQPLEADPFDVKARGGGYAPGASQDRNCRSFDGTVLYPSLWNAGRSDGSVLFQKQPSITNVSVDEVDFADGTSWHAP